MTIAILLYCMAIGYWTPAENRLLLRSYGAASQAKLLDRLPTRTWAAIQKRASGLGLQRRCKKTCQANLNRLLDDTPLAFYWMGFIAADGNFMRNRRLSFMLGHKDRKQIERFAEYIECRSITFDRHLCGVRVQDSIIVPQITHKFNLQQNKTHHPPDLSWIEGDLFVAFLIGFIDGDGSIGRQTGRKDCKIQIKCHAAWLQNLQWMSDRISCLAGVKAVKARINKSGYTSMAFSNCLILKFLKLKGAELGLPVLERKWKIIDEGKVSRYEVAQNNRDGVLLLKEQGYRADEIAERTGLSIHGVYAIVKKLKQEGRWVKNHAA